MRHVGCDRANEPCGLTRACCVALSHDGFCLYRTRRLSLRSGTISPDDAKLVNTQLSAIFGTPITALLEPASSTNVVNTLVEAMSLLQTAIREVGACGPAWVETCSLPPPPPPPSFASLHSPRFFFACLVLGQGDMVVSTRSSTQEAHVRAVLQQARDADVVRPF